MKNNILLKFIALHAWLFSAFLLSTTAQAFALEQTKVILNARQWTITVSSDHLNLKVDSPEKSWSCKIIGLETNGRRISNLKLNYEETALILTDVDYLPVNKLQNCEEVSLKSSHIPDKSGFLVDINLQYGIYLALDTVYTSPFAYAAIVAKLSSRKLLVNLPGAYLPRASLKQLQKNAFQYNEETDSPRISLNGRYVSASGSINCGGHPGVWDLKTKRAVTFPDVSQSERKEQCEALFSK
jgi:hypothetical protein